MQRPSYQPGNGVPLRLGRAYTIAPNQYKRSIDAMPTSDGSGGWKVDKWCSWILAAVIVLLALGYIPLAIVYSHAVNDRDDYKDLYAKAISTAGGSASSDPVGSASSGTGGTVGAAAPATFNNTCKNDPWVFGTAQPLDIRPNTIKCEISVDRQLYALRTNSSHDEACNSTRTNWNSYVESGFWIRITVSTGRRRLGVAVLHDTHGTVELGRALTDTAKRGITGLVSTFDKGSAMTYKVTQDTVDIPFDAAHDAVDYLDGHDHRPRVSHDWVTPKPLITGNCICTGLICKAHSDASPAPHLTANTTEEKLVCDADKVEDALEAKSRWLDEEGKVADAYAEMPFHWVWHEADKEWESMLFPHKYHDCHCQYDAENVRSGGKSMCYAPHHHGTGRTSITRSVDGDVALLWCGAVGSLDYHADTAANWVVDTWSSHIAHSRADAANATNASNASNTTGSGGR